MNTPAEKDLTSITEVPAAAGAAAAAVTLDHLELAGHHLNRAKEQRLERSDDPGMPGEIFHLMVAAIHALIGIGRKIEVL